MSVPGTNGEVGVIKRSRSVKPVAVILSEAQRSRRIAVDRRRTLTRWNPRIARACTRTDGSLTKTFVRSPRKRHNRPRSCQKKSPRRIHSHRVACRHRDHGDFGRPALSRFQSSSKPSQTNAGKKRSHPNRQCGERVLYRIRKVSAGITADTSYGPGNTPATNETLFTELRGCTAAIGSCPAAATTNTRQIVFISPPDVKNSASPRSGIGTTTGGTPNIGQYFDPWGNNYVVRIDGGYNNQLANPYTADTVLEPEHSTIGVIAWSVGSDGKSGWMSISGTTDILGTRPTT